MAYEELQEEGRAGVSNGDAEEATEVNRNGIETIDHYNDRKLWEALGCCAIHLLFPCFTLAPTVLFFTGIEIVREDGWTPLAIFFLCLLPSIIVLSCFCWYCCHTMHNCLVCESDPPQSHMAYEELQEEGRAGVLNGDAKEATEVKQHIDYARIQSNMLACGKATTWCFSWIAAVVAAFACFGCVVVPFVLVGVALQISKEDGWTPFAIFSLCLLPSIIVIICLCCICCHTMDKLGCLRGEPSPT